MVKPDVEMPGDATPGEWKALLAPMLATAESGADVNVYVVITQNTRGRVELCSNMPDRALRELLLLVTPGGSRG